MPQIVKKWLQACAGCCCMVVMLPSVALPQTAKRMEKAADDAFARKDYYSASRLYAAILYDSPLTSLGNTARMYPFLAGKTGRTERPQANRKQELVFKLAEAYRLYNRPDEALQQYERYLASGDTRHPIAQLWYGYSLIAGNEPEKATAAFNTYLKGNRTKDANAVKAREGIASAAFIMEGRSAKQKEEVTRLKATNPVDGSDFALEKINDSMFWFTTSRHELDKKGEKIYPIRLYAGNLNNAAASKPVMIPGELNVATPSLSADGLTMYFTGWKTNEKTGAGTPYHIYYMTRNAVDSPWHPPVDMDKEVNMPGYHSKQPYITRNNQYLFFASDRPGGAGKFDIWMVRMNGRNASGKAIHLNDINTAGEEVTPFYDADAAQLYFSSDGRVGMGGLDIYSAEGEPSANQWKQITNPGAPLNSVRDDQYYRRERNTQTAYLSSDRASSCCLEIFKAVPVKFMDTTRAEIKTVKTETPQPVITPPPADSLTEQAKNRRLLDSLNAITLARNYVHYDYASVKIRGVDRKQLADVVKRMQADPELNIVVASFTDCNGTVAGNIRVAKARSASVKAYLVAKGISAARINTDFFSQKHFVLPCTPGAAFDREAQLVNRRTDLIVTREKNPRWRPMGNELDLDAAEDNPLFRSVRTNPDPAARVPAKNTAPKQVENNSAADDHSLLAMLNKEDKAGDAMKPVKETKKTVPAPSATAVRKPASSADKSSGTSSYKKVTATTGSRKPVATKDKADAEKDRRVAQNITGSTAQDRAAVSPPAILNINSMLDFTPRVKTGIIARMTQRIPRKPVYVYSTSDSVRVDLYDNGVYDSDSVSVIFNKQLVAYQQVLQTSKPVRFYVKLSSDPAKNEMIFFAENLGLTPPNSALMVITDSENRRTEINVASDLEHNTVIYFIKRKKE